MHTTPQRAREAEERAVEAARESKLLADRAREVSERGHARVKDVERQTSREIEQRVAEAQKVAEELVSASDKLPRRTPKRSDKKSRKRSRTRSRKPKAMQRRPSSVPGSRRPPALAEARQLADEAAEAARSAAQEANRQAQQLQNEAEQRASDAEARVTGGRDAILGGDLTGVQAAEGWPDASILVPFRVAVKRNVELPGWFVTLDGVVIGDCHTHGAADEDGDIEIGYALVERIAAVATAPSWSRRFRSGCSVSPVSGELSRASSERQHCVAPRARAGEFRPRALGRAAHLVRALPAGLGD